MIIEYLKEGLSQQEISERLKMDNIKPNSLSSVEKRLNQIRQYYNAKTMFHLAYILSNRVG